MNMRGNRFETDRENGKLLGVCAGIANATGFDVTIVRIGFVLATIVGGFPWTLIAYGIAAMVGKPRNHSGYSLARSTSAEEQRQRMRNIDLRMQAIETYVTSSNSQLAREIEELR
ncbi:MAG TPA: PspC domain-containing protein [Allosphingosinicella sp.]|jgi:phage shock protein C